MIAPMRVVVPRRHPDQVLVAGFLVLIGMSIVFGGPKPGSISALLPPTLVYLWAGVLVVGGVATLIAAVVRSVEVALYLELLAHPPVAVMLWVYAASAFVAGGWKAVAAVGILAGLGLARTVRAWQVFQSLRVLLQWYRTRSG